MGEEDGTADPMVLATMAAVLALRPIQPCGPDALRNVLALSGCTPLLADTRSHPTR